MESLVNKLGQPVGELVKGWVVPDQPRKSKVAGRYCTLEPLIPEDHSTQLFDAYSHDKTWANWTYLPYGPFLEPEHFLA